MNLEEMIREEEAKLLAQARADIAAEKAAYDALPQAEKDRLFAEAEAKWAAFDEACQASEGDEDGDEEGDEE